jgi:hypothetical protein
MDGIRNRSMIQPMPSKPSVKNQIVPVTACRSRSGERRESEDPEQVAQGFAVGVVVHVVVLQIQKCSSKP